MPQRRHGLFRVGAFVPARGHRPSINVQISPPNISTLTTLNLSPSSVSQPQNLLEHLQGDSDLGHLECDVAAVVDDLRADLDQLLLQACAKRAGCSRAQLGLAAAIYRPEIAAHPVGRCPQPASACHRRSQRPDAMAGLGRSLAAYCNRVIVNQAPPRSTSALRQVS